jgi:hypothetical protein
LDEQRTEFLADRLYFQISDNSKGTTNVDCFNYLQTNFSVSKEEYEAVRNYLVATEKVRKKRGRGGGLVKTEYLDEIVVVAPIARIKEEDLYQGMKSVIETDWLLDSGRQYFLAEITGKQGSRLTGGTWTRPDIVCVGVKTFTHIPGKYIEVHTFEVKPSDQIDVRAVYEAMAHRRAATHSYVLLHTPEPNSLKLPQVISAASENGIGVILASDPSDYNTWDQVVDPIRVDPNPENLDDFIRTQLSEELRNYLIRAGR